jgi:transmembrane sensor
MAEEYTDHLSAWISGTMSDADFAAVASKKELVQYKQILNEVDTWVPTNDEIAFDLATFRSQKKAKQVFFSTQRMLMVAASISLLVACYFIFFQNKNSESVYVADGGIKEILLPDGNSKIFLSQGSKVTWKEVDWNEENRELSLEGKAYLEVEKGSPFKVNTVNGAVEVLGTRFEVDGAEDWLSVTCFEGKVRATHQQTATIVSASESFLYYDHAWEQVPMNLQEKPTWFDGETKFKNAPLSQVLSTLKALYGVEFVADQVDMKRRFTGAFPNENLAVALKIIFTPLNISYTIEDKRITLKSESL